MMQSNWFPEYRESTTAIQTNADIKRARATADALNGTIGALRRGNATGDINFLYARLLLVRAMTPRKRFCSTERYCI